MDVGARFLTFHKVLTQFFEKSESNEAILNLSFTASLHTSSGPRQSRIKWGHTHKPFYHVKKTNKAIDEPLTAANRAFVQEAMKDAYVPDFDDGRFVYITLIVSFRNSNFDF